MAFVKVADAGDLPERGLLGVEAGTAALVITALGRTEDGRPLWWERTAYRGDAYAFTLSIGSGSSIAGAMRLVE